MKRSASQVTNAIAEPPSKAPRHAPSTSSLQRDLQHERERNRRLSESVEQLRLELQMMGRVLASTREQLVAAGAMTPPPHLGVRVPATYAGPRQGRSKADAKLVQRLQEELSESKGQCRRLGEQADGLQAKLAVVVGLKKELLGVLTEMNDYLLAHR
ncbi:hypothetical protein AB1Y20_010882 [Prymnesium parvum]|uniref:Uncharacterized protein n=1 Tax=Prymnesium parvum TaxID=97485 RepID=A0AB34IQJ2_PRYPA